MAARLMTLGGCVLLLILSSARISLCSSWWSLALVDNLSLRVVNRGSVLCEQLHNVLNTTAQQSFCTYNQGPINYIAIGTRNGIVACQETFAESRWNCTTFDGEHLFGSFVTDDTRETAVINAFLSAGGIRRMAHACRDEELKPNCTCLTIGFNGYENGSYYTYECSYNVEVAERTMLQFLKKPTIDSSSVIAHQNEMVGSYHVKQLKRKCRCIGLSGSCAAQTCHYASPSLETIGAELRNKYASSVQVTVSFNNNKTTLTPVVPNVDYNMTTDLVYTGTSPTFCSRDSSKGILGTSGRPCNASVLARDSCSVICCGRGYNTITVTENIECCEFVFCCRVDCHVCGTKSVTTYHCK